MLARGFAVVGLSACVVKADGLSVLKRLTATFASDLVQLASGSALAQGLTMLGTLLLTQLYEPAAFGVLAIFNSLLTVVAVVSCLRYEVSILLPVDDEAAANQLAVSVLIVLVIGSLTMGLTILAGDFLASWLRAPLELRRWLFLLPLAVLGDGVLLAFTSWNTRLKRFGRLSVAQVYTALLRTGPQLALGMLGRRDGGSLILGSSIGIIGAGLLLAVTSLRDDWELLHRSVAWRGMLLGISRYRKFPVYDAAALLLNTVSWQLPVVVLSRFYSSSIVGYFSLADRLLRTPMNVIGRAISQVFAHRVSVSRDVHATALVVENTFRRLVAIGLWPMLLVALVGPEAFATVFGHAWREAGVYAEIMSIYMLSWFLSSPLSAVFRLLERQELSLKINILIIAVRFAALSLGSSLGNARTTLALFSLSGAFLYAYLMHSILSISRVSRVGAAGVILQGFRRFVPVGAVLLSLKLLGAGSWLLVSLGLLALFAYYARTGTALLRRSGIG